MVGNLHGIEAQAISTPPSIRLIPRLRAVHIERFFETAPATMVYFEDSYDLEGSRTPGNFQRLTLPQALRFFFFSNAKVLELPEPLWVRFLPTGALCAASFKLGGKLRRVGHGRIIATYCMENSTISRLIGRHWVPPHWLVTTFSSLVGLYIRTFIDRMVFASDFSRELYSSLPFVDGVESTTILELPVAQPQNSEPNPNSFIFVGTTDARKGVPILLEAWPEVERAIPDATLTIIGPQAQETPDLVNWATERPHHRHYLGQLSRDEVLKKVSKSSVLVLPSVPHGRWREQIGLPIKEALGFGLTVVTTDQSGLAPWLKENGHRVIEPDTLREQLGNALIEAARDPLPREAVRASLPTTQGRYASDTWMHRPTQVK